MDQGAAPLRVVVRGATDDGAVPLGDDPALTVVRSTRELVMSGSRADLAVIVVDALDGITARTRRDTAIVGLIGIDPVVLAVDGCNGNEARFREIERDIAGLAKRLGIDHVTVIPLAIARGGKIAWHDGPTLGDYLDTARRDRAAGPAFRFQVAGVGPGAACTGIMQGGTVGAGDRVRIWPSRAEAGIARIDAADGDAVSLRLDAEVAVAPGRRNSRRRRQPRGRRPASGHPDLAGRRAAGAGPAFAGPAGHGGVRGDGLDPQAPARFHHRRPGQCPVADAR